LEIGFAQDASFEYERPFDKTVIHVIKYIERFFNTDTDTFLLFQITIQILSIGGGLVE
jgi:hypothetical protein